MRYTKLFRGLVVAVLMLSATSASSQPHDYASFVPALVKSVLFDPTTYGPAIVAWESTRLDWQSSQVFFQHGFPGAECAVHRQRPRHGSWRWVRPPTTSPSA
jgi:hypothetical protein